MPRLSIIVPCWIVDAELLACARRCIDSIYAHVDVPFELILIDNGSEHPLTEEALSRFATRFVRNDRNLGYGAAVNQGFRHARGDYVAVMNDDIVVGPYWASGLIEAANEVEPVACSGPALMRPELYQAGEDSARAIARVQRSGSWRPAYRDFELFEPLDGWGALYLAHRETFRRVLLPDGSLLDPRFELGMWEDRDLWARLYLAGHRCIRTHRVWVEHVGNASWNRLADPERIYRRNQRLYEELMRERGYRRDSAGKLVPVPDGER